ncbi:putative fungal pheromone GPCR, STE3-type [Mycena alexandri]|uniref:Fungal pheromone GPCR, STE3-type n=1 Tax=Mycena alexandri TaxID=1745969 RepID=A0AAD6SII1_9AGAR|nr:putative fungal pheromone GPCR, STE3-type [Mycena alexandri]
MPGALYAPAFVAAALVLVPLPGHWRARNIPTLSIISWLFILNVSYGVNAVVWAGNTDLVLPVWCDIVTKIKIGATFALPSSCLCLAVQLHAIASFLKTSNRRRRAMVLDLVLCYGLPILIMALHYIVQGHRYDIVEDFGCRPAMYISWLSLLLVDLPPAIASFLALVFCGLALSSFFRRRSAFIHMIKESDSGLTTSRYVRLMAMTTLLGTWNAIVIGIGLWATYSDGLRPWTSWADVHFNFSRIQPYPIAEFPGPLLRLTYLLWAAVPISALLFFSFFAFGEDAMKEYRNLRRWFRRKVLNLPDPQPLLHRTEIPSLYASSFGDASDVQYGTSLRQPSQALDLEPPLRNYVYPSRHYSATTFASETTIIPIEYPTIKDENFYNKMEFWAI